MWLRNWDNIKTLQLINKSQIEPITREFGDGILSLRSLDGRIRYFSSKAFNGPDMNESAIASYNSFNILNEDLWFEGGTIEEFLNQKIYNDGKFQFKTLFMTVGTGNLTENSEDLSNYDYYTLREFADIGHKEISFSSAMYDKSDFTWKKTISRMFENDTDNAALIREVGIFALVGEYSDYDSIDEIKEKTVSECGFYPVLIYRTTFVAPIEIKPHSYKNFAITIKSPTHTNHTSQPIIQTDQEDIIIETEENTDVPIIDNPDDVVNTPPSGDEDEDVFWG